MHQKNHENDFNTRHDTFFQMPTRAHVSPHKNTKIWQVMRKGFFWGETCSARLEHNPLRVMRMRKMFSVVFPTFPSCHVLNLSDISKTKPGCNYTHYSMQPTSVTMRQKKLTWEQDALTVPVISFTDLKTNHTHTHARARTPLHIVACFWTVHYSCWKWFHISCLTMVGVQHRRVVQLHDFKAVRDQNQT